jgi:integrase
MKNLATKSNDAAADMMLRLPEVAFTRSGIAFRPNDDVWSWTDGPFKVHLDFRKLELPVTIPKDSLRRTLLVFAKRNSASHLSNLFNAFVHFLAQRSTAISLTTVSAAEVSNYSTRLQNHEKWRLGTLNVVLQKWVALGLEGVEPDCTQYLSELRKPGNEKGAAVRTRDPVKGPFSEDEYTLLYKAVDTAYGKGDIKLWTVVLARLLFASGGRISQYASLKVNDLKINNGAYVIQLPQAKTREANSRTSFKEFDLSPQTGRIIAEYIEILKIDGFDNNAALFPEDVVMPYGPREQHRSEGDLFFGHCTRATLSSNFSSIMRSISPPSERLHFDAIPISAQRFRYTFATRLAEEGASMAVIADQLGHADLQNVEVYYEASPKIVDNIDKAIGVALAPLSRAFMGRLVESEQHSTMKGASGSRIIDFRAAPEPIGSCAGSGRRCAFNKPVACYTCFKFEPWLDAPHEKVLRRLEDERERFSNDDRMAAVNDDAICAVREVIAECATVLECRGLEDKS